MHTVSSLFISDVTYYLTSLCRNRATRILEQRQTRSTLKREKQNRSPRREAALDPGGSRWRTSFFGSTDALRVRSTWVIDIRALKPEDTFWIECEIEQSYRINRDKYRSDLDHILWSRRDTACESWNHKRLYIIKWTVREKSREKFISIKYMLHITENNNNKRGKETLTKWNKNIKISVHQIFCSTIFLHYF